MRTVFATLSLSVLFSIAISSANAQQQSIPNDTTPVTPYMGAQSEEPNLKKIGNTIDSSLITDAPLPNDYVMGKKDAPVLLIEYASLSCPHCAHFSNVILPELQKKYIETGKIRYILRHFPLNEPALKGAILVNCVGEKNHEKYFVFSKVLFDAQKKWAFDGNYMSGLETIANVGGISTEQFQACMNNTDLEMKILTQKKLANEELKIPHTPYIIIDGEAFDNKKTSFENIAEMIDKKLAEKTAKK